ncbi:unnamed protein product [Moneuplotes crassus]|uniref:Uncharacterized protein n=1 Tax=Euplotes crassus TaxID=5936 RepID=A0AAD1XZP8_EUPCR|nr:unnamed protein product [Moneuplotes crassus]
MIAKTEDKVIEVLEFVLDIIQMYDGKYHKKRYLLEQQSRKTGKKPAFGDRLEYITDDFNCIFRRYTSNAYKYVEDSNVVDVIKDQCIELYDEACNFSKCIYTDLLVPLGKGMVLVYSSTGSKMSLLCTRVEFTWILEKLSKCFANTKLFLTNQWMRLDFDCDESVSISDLINSLSFSMAFMKEICPESLQQSKVSSIKAPEKEEGLD